MLSRDNFRQWITNLQAAAQRLQHHPDQGRSSARYCELIGNVCWHFAPEEAAAWFKRSLDLRRSADWEPNWVSASLLWKLGDAEALRLECTRAIEIHRTRLHDLQDRERPKERSKARDRQAAIFQEFHELTAASFFLQDFRAAAEWAESGVQEVVRWNQWDAGPSRRTSSVCVFVRDACGAILSRNAESLRSALGALRSDIEMWPTDAGNLVSELYRFGLWLDERNIPSSSRGESQETM